MSNLMTTDLLSWRLSDGDADGIMVIAEVVWTVQHDINLNLAVIMVAVDMVNMSPF